jgi:hypothetical protein
MKKREKMVLSQQTERHEVKHLTYHVGNVYQCHDDKFNFSLKRRKKDDDHFVNIMNECCRQTMKCFFCRPIFCRSGARLFFPPKAEIFKAIELSTASYIYIPGIVLARVRISLKNTPEYKNMYLTGIDYSCSVV